MKTISFLSGREVNRQAEKEVNSLKQTLKKEKNDFVMERTQNQTLKKDKNNFIRRFDMYLIYADMNRRFGKGKAT
jgi:hypothetical protein